MNPSIIAKIYSQGHDYIKHFLISEQLEEFDYVLMKTIAASNHLLGARITPRHVTIVEICKFNKHYGSVKTTKIWNSFTVAKTINQETAGILLQEDP
jgi:hypothetical protein